ncbi:MAG: 50S ribosomal protein L17 [Simkania negevensis]|nr:50S ribosomal protein L17 [Simkania negevensis]
MRHRNNTGKLGKTSSHRRCMIANQLKSLVVYGRVETTVVKAKVLRSYADRLITLAKKNTLASRRAAIGKLMIQSNPLTSKEAREAKKGNLAAYNDDRKVMTKLFGELGPRFVSREGGYTRIIKKETRRGDRAALCLIEYIEA